MSLSQSKLSENLNSAFQKVQDENLSSFDAAQEMASAIVDYANDAEILTIPGPFLIPAGSPDTSLLLPKPKTLKVATPSPVVSAASNALGSAIFASFEAKDPTLVGLSTALIAFTSAYFTIFSDESVIPVTATGLTVMAPPGPAPAFVSALAAGLSGAERARVIEVMSAGIHLSFLASIFTGVAVNPSVTSTGPVTGPLI